MVTHHQYPPATPTRLSEFSREEDVMFIVIGPLFFIIC